MLSDFLIEDQCPAGHTSSVLLRGHTGEIASGVAALLGITCGRCRWHLDGAAECGEPIARRIVEIPHESEAEAFRNAATVPAPPHGPSVIVTLPESAPDSPQGPRSSLPPRDGEPPEGGIFSGD